MLRNAPVQTAQPVHLRVRPRARVQLVRFEERPQPPPLRRPRLASRETGHDIDELQVEHVVQLGAQRVVVQRAEVHAAVEDDLADRGRAEEVGDRLEGGRGEVGHVDEVRARVGGRAAEDDDGERATGRAEVVSLAVEDEHGACTKRGSRALALCGGIAKNHGLAVGDRHPGI